jgi:phage terminase large subunit-like protein
MIRAASTPLNVSLSSFRDRFSLKWTKYIPYEPTSKQLVGLTLPNREILFGGAAGGGKSIWLLMGALQYVDVPGYSAIIFRTELTAGKMSSSIFNVALTWLADTDAKFSPQDNRFTFPSGASLQFGYLGDFNVYARYDSSEFQYVGFDEVSHFNEQDYLYLFTRLRRRNEINAPLRMRCASNPPKRNDPATSGWLKKRFQIKNVNGKFLGTHPSRLYLPSFVTDNPHVDQEGYIESLQELDPVTREQMLAGNWDVQEAGRFKYDWVKRYSLHGDYIYLGPGRTGKTIHRAACRCFQTVDPAASLREMPGGASVYKNDEPSWTVISTWFVTPDNDLIFWDMVRFQKEIPDIFPHLNEAYQLWRPDYIAIESNGANLGVFQIAQRKGLPIRGLNPRAADKVTRATPAMVQMKAGRIWFPEYIHENTDNRFTQPDSALADAETEIFAWIGHPRQQDDIVDTLAYAALEVANYSSADNPLSSDSVPSAWGASSIPGVWGR